METGKIKSFFDEKMKKSPTFSYNIPYENHEKSPVMKLKSGGRGQNSSTIT